MTKYEEALEKLKGMKLESHPFNIEVTRTDFLTLDISDLPEGKAEAFLEEVPYAKEVRVMRYAEHGQEYLLISVDEYYDGVSLMSIRIPQL